MDFQHTFRQGHQDHLEDAGVKQYRPADGFNLLKAKRENKQTIVKRLRPLLATIVNLVAK